MTYRLYLTATAAPIGATASASWLSVASMAQGKLSPSKGGTLSTSGVAETSALTFYTQALGQWVSDPFLRSGTISGPVTINMHRLASASGAAFQTRWKVRVVSADGLTELAAYEPGEANQWLTTPGGALATANPTTVGPFSVSAGQRLVVEYGYLASNAVTTSYTGTITYGGAGADLVDGATSNAGAAWIDFPDTVGTLWVPKGVPLFPLDGGSGRLAVEVAWGADLSSTTGASWTWTDITTDVRIDGALACSLGRNDEAASAGPAKLNLELDNTSGRYSLGGQSVNWPNVRRNVPLRVSVTLASTEYLLFQGYVAEWAPGWTDDKGRLPVVKVEASGALRRLGQGRDPLRSALYRFHTIGASTRPLEYWPLEEDKSAGTGVSAVGGSSAYPSFLDTSGSIQGKFAWGADTDNPATEQAPVMSRYAALNFPCRASLYTASSWTMTWSMRYSSNTGLFMWIDTDDVDQDRIYSTWYTGGTADFLGVYNYGASASATVFTANQGNPTLWDDIWHSYMFDVNGSTWALYKDGTLMTFGTYSQGSVGRPTNVYFLNPSPAPTDDDGSLSVAHLAVWKRSTFPGLPVTAAAAAAHTGETVSARLVRLCAEQAVDLVQGGSSTVAMGPQRPEALLDLLHECEDADLGVLYDGVGPGLAYVARSTRENAAVAQALSITDLTMPFEPTHDDQRTVNRATATGRGGTKYTAQDVTGPMGTAAIGVYDGSTSVNLATDNDVPGYANWLVHQGTVEGYRYPALTVDVRAKPTLAAAIAQRRLSDRVTVSGVATYLTGLPDEVADVLVEGLAWVLDPNRWRITLKCSPTAPWSIVTAAVDTGATGDYLFRVDTDGSTLGASITAGATSISVVTPSGPLWTTTADDLPFDLDIGGVKVTVTACSGASSPQAMTITAAPVARTSGARVQLWNPPVLGL